MYFIKLWHKHDYYFSKYFKLVALSSVFFYIFVYVAISQQYFLRVSVNLHTSTHVWIGIRNFLFRVAS